MFPRKMTTIALSDTSVAERYLMFKNKTVDVATAKKIIEEDDRKRWLKALVDLSPSIIEVTIYAEGGSLRQMVELNPDGTWRLHNA